MTNTSREYSVTDNGGAQPRILIVDDDENAARMLGRLLTEDGYSVVVAFDGVSAFARLESARFDVLITDLRMPHIGGLAVATFAQKQPQGPALVVIVTSYPELIARAEPHLRNALVMAKPIDYVSFAAELAERVRLIRETRSANESVAPR